MLDLLTTEQAAHAAAHGWQLGWVYDLNTRHITANVLPAWNSGQITCAPDAVRLVVAMAKNRDEVALKAIQLAAQSRQGMK